METLGDVLSRASKNRHNQGAGEWVESEAVKSIRGACPGRVKRVHVIGFSTRPDLSSSRIYPITATFPLE